MLKGKNIHAKLPFSCKKGYDSGIVIPKKARYCTEYEKDSICSGCDKMTKKKILHQNSRN